MKIILLPPGDPENAGNVARTCAVTGTQLILVRPLEFNLTDKHLKRSGLDYWDDVDLRIVDTLDEALESLPCLLLFDKGRVPYTDIRFESDVHLVFHSKQQGCHNGSMKSGLHGSTRSP